MRQLPLDQEHPSDRGVRLLMRIVGVVLIAVSAFFLTRDIVQGGVALWFLSSSIGLGGLTLVSSWLPGPRRRAVGRPSFRSAQD